MNKQPYDTSIDDASAEGSTPKMTLSSDEVNYLVYRYLQESGFVHSSFTFAHESMLGRTGLRAADKSLPPGALITFLQKGLQYVGIEESLARDIDNASKSISGEEDVDFSILSPAAITAISRQNPPIQLNVPPATAAAAVRARLEAEANIQAQRSSAVVPTQMIPNPTIMSQATGAPVLLDDQNAALARQALAAQAAAAHAAAAMSQLQQMSHAGIADTYSQNRILPGTVGVMAMQQGMVQPPSSLVTDTSTLIDSAGAKRGSTNSNRVPKKQKTPKVESSRTHPESAFATLEEAAARLEAKEQGMELERELANMTAMDVEENDNAGEMESARPAHIGQETTPLPDQELINGEKEHNGVPGKIIENRSEGSNGASEKGQAGKKSKPNDGEPDNRDTDASQEEILRLEMHQSEVFMCAWNPVHTTLIATGSGDASARIWEIAGDFMSTQLRNVKVLSHGTDTRDRKNKDVTTLEWSSDGDFLATGSYDGIARVWARNGTLMHTLRGHSGPIFSLKWNKSGKYLLSGSYDKTTIAWDVSGGNGFIEQQFLDHQAPALDVDWKDDLTFASCSTDKTVHICKIGVSAPLKVYVGHQDEVNAVKWDPSGRFLASCSDDCTAKVWDAESDRSDPLYDFTSHEAEIYTVKWSPTGPGSANASKLPLLATASFDGSVRLWKIEDGSCYRVFNRHQNSVYSVAFSPSGDYLASGSLAGQMYIWNIEQGRHVKSYRGKGDIFEVAWNKEETRLAACFSSGVVTIIDFDRSKLR